MNCECGSTNIYRRPERDKDGDTYCRCLDCDRQWFEDGKAVA